METTYRSEKKSLYFALVSICVIILSLTLLSVLRIYSIRLDYKLHKINTQIQNMEIEEKNTVQYFSYLVAPNRILKISKEVIGMNSISFARTIYVKNNLNNQNVNSDSVNISKNIFIDLFMSKAYAK